jgi:hypothetical protein
MGGCFPTLEKLRSGSGHSQKESVTRKPITQPRVELKLASAGGLALRFRVG